MKNLKKNAILLSLGLLVSGSSIYAAVTEKDLIANIQKALTDVQTTKKVNITGDWTKVTAQAIDFIQTGANSFPKSDTLTFAAQTARNFLNTITKNIKGTITPQQAQQNMNITDQLATALARVADTTYYRSEKISANKVFQELKKLLNAVAVTLRTMTPTQAQVARPEDAFLKNIKTTQEAQKQGLNIQEAQKAFTTKQQTPAKTSATTPEQKKTLSLEQAATEAAQRDLNDTSIVKDVFNSNNLDT